MKKTSFLVTILLVIMAAAVAVVSCKKESPSAMPINQGQTSVSSNTTAESTLARIMDFKGKMEYYRAHLETKGGESMTIEDAIWNVEALFNLTYAYPELAYNHTVVCDTVLYLDIDADGTVPLSRLTAFYDEMHDVVAALYHGLDIDNKQFLILDVEEGERQDGSLAVGLHSVQGSVREDGDIPPEPDVPTTEIGPFVYGPSWYYGENGGNSWGIEPMDMDAADTLSLMLNARLVPQAPEGYVYFYTNTIMNELQPNYHLPYSHPTYPNVGQYCEFYVANPSESDYWLDTDQLNFHYFGEKHLVKKVLPTYNGMTLPDGHRLFNIIIEDYREINESYQTTAIGHHTKAYYGQRWVIMNEEVERGNL